MGCKRSAFTKLVDCVQVEYFNCNKYSSMVNLTFLSFFPQPLASHCLATTATMQAAPPQMQHQQQQGPPAPHAGVPPEHHQAVQRGNFKLFALVMGLLQPDQREQVCLVATARLSSHCYPPCLLRGSVLDCRGRRGYFYSSHPHCPRRSSNYPRSVSTIQIWPPHCGIPWGSWLRCYKRSCKCTPCYRPQR